MTRRTILHIAVPVAAWSSGCLTGTLIAGTITPVGIIVGVIAYIATAVTAAVLVAGNLNPAEYRLDIRHVDPEILGARLSPRRERGRKEG